MSEERPKGGTGAGSDGDSRAGEPRPGLMSRRQLLAGAGGLAAAAALGAAGCSSETVGEEPSSRGGDEGTEGSSQGVPDPVGGGDVRRDRAYQIRADAARYQRDLPAAEHPDNGDDERYPNKPFA